MNDLNWTALFGFLAGVWLFLTFAAAQLPESEKAKNAFTFSFFMFVLFGSLTALTWGG